MEKLCIDEIDEIDNNDLSQALFYAAQLNNDANVIEFLLQNKANPNYQNNNCDKQTPLMTASHNNKIKNVEVLLQYNDDINQSDINNDTALSLAVAIKDESIVKLLLKSGANPNIQDVDGITPLLWIIRDIENENCVYMNIVKSLLEYNANPNIADDEDKTPILSAAFVAQYNIVYDIIALLLNAGANINAIDDEGFNVAEYVCIDKKYNDNCKQILTLLNNQSIAINNKPFTIQIEDFWDCIDTNSRQDFVKALVELRILTDFTLDQDNQKTLSLLHWAMKLHDFDLVNTILAHGGDFYACDDDGVSSLEIAINMLLKSKQLQIKEQDIVDILTTSSLTLGNYSTYDLNNIEGINTFIKVLIASRYLKIEGEHGSRLLDFYIIKQDVEMVKFLLEKGVQPSKNYTRIIFLDKTKESEEIQKLLHKNHIQNLSITVQEDNLEQYLGLDITDESNQEFLVIGNTNNIVDDF